MEQAEIDNLARTWIANVEKLIKARADRGIPDIPLHDLDSMVYDDPENAWLIIDAARRMTQDDLMLANIAAGPLENLLSKHGEKFIERFEALAKIDEPFAFLMTGVWPRGMSKELVERCYAFSRFTKRHL